MSQHIVECMLRKGIGMPPTPTAMRDAPSLEFTAGDNQLKKFSFWLLTSSLVVCALLQIVFVSKMLDRFKRFS